jgi:flagellar biosynthesis/type III secretory pathway chaperone
MDMNGHRTALYTFFETYADFFEEVSNLEQEKLSVLLSGLIPQIEQMITRQQSVAKRMENIERKRIELQKAAGMEHFTFKDILGQAADEDRMRLQVLFQRTRSGISNIKYFNDKSMECARARLQKVHESKGVPTHCGYSRNHSGISLRSVPIMETKV